MTSQGICSVNTQVRLLRLLLYNASNACLSSTHATLFYSLALRLCIYANDCFNCYLTVYHKPEKICQLKRLLAVDPFSNAHNFHLEFRVVVIQCKATLTNVVVTEEPCSCAFLAIKPINIYMIIFTVTHERAFHSFFSERGGVSGVCPCSNIWNAAKSVKNLRIRPNWVVYLGSDLVLIAPDIPCIPVHLF